MKMIKCLLLVLSISLTSFAQENEEKEKTGNEPSSWFTGGSISLGYGGGSSYTTFIAGIHPHYGYKIAKWIDAAAVVNFEYQSQRDYYNNKFRNTTYGIGVFTRIYPVHFLFIQAQPEHNFIKQKYIPNGSGQNLRANLEANSFLIGGGYTTSNSGNNTFTYLSILVDIVKDINSPYVDGYGNIVPIIRAGVNIGLNRKTRK